MNNPLLVDSFVAPPCNEDIEVLFQDQSLLVIEKPSGLLSLSGKNPLNLDSVHHRLAQVYPGVTMVHRLDLGTSGLMVLALSKDVNANLTKQFQARTVHKQYLAMLYGHLAETEGCIDAPLTKALFPRHKVCYETGKDAQSHYRVLEYLQHNNTAVKTTKVMFTPRTGRTHQLRVHSQEIGHPIIGCDLYGAQINGIDTQTLSDRLALHASRLEFDHPISGDRMVFESNSDFAQITAEKRSE